MHPRFSKGLYMKIEKLIDKNGRINGPKLPHLTHKEIEEIESLTIWLNDLNPSLKHRIKAIFLNQNIIKECEFKDCSKPAAFSNEKDKLFSRFCSCQCASNFARSDETAIQKLKDSVSSRIDIMRQAAKKGRESQIKKFGGYGFQRADIQKKIQANQISGPSNWYKWKDYDAVRVQGFEDLFLDKNPHLISEKKSCPKIQYLNKTYWPDFYDSKTNTVYEVKSVYTLIRGILDHSLVNKVSASLQAGYKFEIHVFESRSSDNSWILDLSQPLSADDVVSNLESFLTSIFEDCPYVLHRLGSSLAVETLEWLDAQRG